MAGKLPELEHLTVNGARQDDGRKVILFPKTTGEAFRYLSSFPKLQSFNRGTHHVYYFNNEAIRLFSAVPHLRVLNMAGATAGEELDYAPLAKCLELETLFVPFARNRGTNDHLGPVIRDLPKLKMVNICNCTDAILPDIAAMPALENFQIRGSVLSADGLRQLAQSKITSVTLGKQAGETVRALKDIAELRTASFSTENFAAVAELRAARPDLKLVILETKPKKAETTDKNIGGGTK